MRRTVRNGGSGARQTHINKVKFNPNRYKLEKDRISKATILSMTSLCCRRCCNIIQWKVDYGKYTSLERARHCNICHENKVGLAYHRICQDCSEKAEVCAKCQKRPLLDVVHHDDMSGSSDFEEAHNGERENQFDFVDLPVEDEELKHLRGLDVRMLQRAIRECKEVEAKDALSSLRERERRTVLRKAGRYPEESDSDESI